MRFEPSNCSISIILGSCLQSREQIGIISRVNTEVLCKRVKGVAMRKQVENEEKKIDRTLVVIDLENACGGSHLVGRHQEAALAAIQSHVEGGDVIYVIATGPSARGDTPDLPFGMPTARWLVGHGLDGADFELLEVLLQEPVAIRSRHVVVVSGDYRFARALHHLACNGVETTVMSREIALSCECRLAANKTVILPDFSVADMVLMEAA
jgi:hypothetical protein